MAVVDCSSEGEGNIRCLECDWSQIVGAVDKGGFWIPTCVAPARSKWGGRCSRDAVLGGYCWQHADRSYSYDIVYERFRNTGGDDLPEAYREIFVRACADAGLLQRHEANESRTRALMAQVSDLRQSERERAKKSLVYFVRREGLIKIGTTTDLTNRLKALSKGGQMPQGMTVGPVELLATVAGGRDLEAKFHRQFGENRIAGTEWFRSTPRLLRLVARFQRRAQAQEVAA